MTSQNMENNQGQSINMRELVLNVLIEVLEKGEYSSIAIGNTLRTYQYLGKQERAFFQRLSEGTIERAIELDYMIDTVSKVKTKKMKPVIRNIMRMAVYQIKYMNQVPNSAACNEAVKLAVRKGFHTLKSFVNGVLRTIIRELDSIVYPDKERNPIEYLSVIYSMPSWLVEKWIAEYGVETTETILRASFEERATTIRCNQSKITVEKLKEQLEQEGIRVTKGDYLPYALYIEGYDSIQRIPAFKQGLFQVQDESSMLVTEAADVGKNDLVIDVCSAPGGKSTHIAEKLQGTGKVIARDITEAKIALVEENKNRSNYQNIETQVKDARVLDKDDIEKADIVIADLPCSGLGILGKKTDIKYKVSKESLKSLVTLQREILDTIWQYVKPGGTLIYSTCTINPEENIANVTWFLERYPFYLESLEKEMPKNLEIQTIKEGYVQLIQGREKTDGFFLAKMKRRES